MDRFGLCLDLFTLAFTSFLHLIFINRLAGKLPKTRYIALYFLMLCAIYAASSRFLWGTLPSAAMEMLALWAVVQLALKIPCSGSWTGAVMAVYVSQLSFGLVGSVVSTLLFFAADPSILPVVRMVSVAASAALCAGCYRLILKFVSLEKDGRAPYIRMLLFPLLFFFCAELYIMDTSYRTVYFPVLPPEVSRHLALLGLQALGLGALLCTLYAYRRACRNFQTQAALDSLTQAVHAQEAYAAQAQLRYEKTRAFRHDLKNHLAVLSGLLKSGKPREAAAYLEKMEAASAALSFPCQTGISAVDILLGEKMELAEACGIAMEISMGSSFDSGINPFDLCVIISNALDNAISACRDVRNNRIIRVCQKRQGDFYLLLFENACLKGAIPPEGTGLANIRRAAEKYHGTVMIEKSGTEFRLSVLLNPFGQSDAASG